MPPRGWHQRLARRAEGLNYARGCVAAFRKQQADDAQIRAVPGSGKKGCCRVVTATAGAVFSR